jgi:hypothetical protein
MPHKFTKDTFVKKVKEANPFLEPIVKTYRGVDSRYQFKCEHGIFESYGWQLLKPRKYCCSHSYYLKRKPALKKDIEKRKEEIINVWGKDKYILDNLRFDKDNRKLILECAMHGEFSQWTRSLVKEGIVKEGCPECAAIAKKQSAKQQAYKNFKAHWGNFNTISKAETNWLNSIGIKERQVFLEDLNYTVDGYDRETNTVYLYHGRFWHGCQDTYKPDDINPVVNKKMIDLYEKTMYYEKRIKDAGYNLVTKWGP